MCPVTEKSASFVVNVYNGIARPVSTYLRLPVHNPALSVFGSNGEPLKSQFVNVSKATAKVRGSRGNAPYELLFQVCAPAIGFSTYFVEERSFKESFAAKYIPSVR